MRKRKTKAQTTDQKKIKRNKEHSTRIYDRNHDRESSKLKEKENDLRRTRPKDHERQTMGSWRSLRTAENAVD